MKKLFPFPTLDTSKDCISYMFFHDGYHQKNLANVLEEASTPSSHQVIGLGALLGLIAAVAVGVRAFEYGALVSGWSAVCATMMAAVSAVVFLRLLDATRAPRWYQKIYRAITKRPFDQASQAVLNHQWDDPALHVFFDNPQRFRILSKDEIEQTHLIYMSLSPAHPCHEVWKDRMAEPAPLRQQDLMIMKRMMELHNQEQQALLNKAVAAPSMLGVERSVEQEQWDARKSLMEHNDVVEVEQENLEIVMSSSLAPADTKSHLS